MRTRLLAFAGASLFILNTGPAAGQGLGAIGSNYGVPEAAAVSPEHAIPLAKSAEMPAPAEAIPVPGQGTPIAYQDPGRGYVVIAPAGARFQHRGAGQPFAIQSRKGYAVNVQVGDANKELATEQMFAKLEQSYLGDGKAWSVKLAEGEAVIAGMPAGTATYESGSSRTRVVIARGEKSDFVFMFFAPTNQFERLSVEFNWIMRHFRPAADEIPAEPVRMSSLEPAQMPKAPLRAQPAPDTIPAGRAAAHVQSSPAEVQVFSEPGYGYRVEYPSEWQLEKVSAYTNIFSGPQGSPAFDAIIAVQNVQPQGAASGAEAASAAFEDLKSSLQRDAKGVDFVGEKAVAYVKQGLNLSGWQFVASYDHQGRRYRKWALVLPRPNGTVAHIWSYTAPSERFDEFRHVAEKMLQSLRIDPEQG